MTTELTPDQIRRKRECEAHGHWWELKSTQRVMTMEGDSTVYKTFVCSNCDDSKVVKES